MHVKKVLLSGLVLFGLAGCYGVPMPAYHTGEDSIYSNAINLVQDGQDQEYVYSLLSTPTKKYLDWSKDDIERNMRKDFTNPKPFNLSDDDKYDLWYYHSVRHETYTDLLQTTTTITIPKYCYLAFSINESKLAWHQCYTAKRPK